MFNEYDDKTIKNGLAEARKNIKDPAVWKEFKEAPKDELFKFHFTLGQYIRNNFDENGWVDDRTSGIILDKWHTILNSEKDKDK